MQQNIDKCVSSKEMIKPFQVKIDPTNYFWYMEKVSHLYSLQLLMVHHFLALTPAWVKAVAATVPFPNLCPSPTLITTLNMGKSDMT